MRDSGMGISPDMLPHIHDLFVQDQRTPDHARGGFGIGLAVVRNLVELHSGRIEALSAGLDQGAEFVVHLPIAEPDEGAVRGRSYRGETQRRERRRELVVEDDVDVSASSMMLLQGHGHVRVARDGISAFDLACSWVPDVMSVDVGLPGIDGHELARRARRTPALREVTLVALTGQGTDEARQRSREAGFDHHATKSMIRPLRPSLLVRRGASDRPRSATGR